MQLLLAAPGGWVQILDATRKGEVLEATWQGSCCPIPLRFSILTIRAQSIAYCCQPLPPCSGCWKQRERLVRQETRTKEERSRQEQAGQKRTLAGPEHTHIMGSSMGGLISYYAMQQYPEVFGGAGCLSTHWVPGRGFIVGWMREGNRPPAQDHRLYFDHGTMGLDADYGPYQASVDKVLLQAGFKDGCNYHSRVHEGEGHHESAWRSRVQGAMRFLLNV